MIECDIKECMCNRDGCCTCRSRNNGECDCNAVKTGEDEEHERN